MTELSETYTLDWFEAHKRGGPQHAAKLEMAEELEDLYEPQSVISLGCGPGWFLEYWATKRPGVHIRGIDGCAEFARSVAHPRVAEVIAEFDLRDSRTFNALANGPRYDLCICCEVAEHIEPAGAGTFMDICCGVANVVFFSAATPGQKGVGHVNCQPRDYWLKAFNVRGFRLNVLAMKTWRQEVTAKACGQIRRHAMIFEGNSRRMTAPLAYQYSPPPPGMPHTKAT